MVAFAGGRFGRRLFFGDARAVHPPSLDEAPQSSRSCCGGVLWGLGIACVLAVVWDSRSRVEMRGHEIWVRNVVGGAQVYRPAEIVSLQVSCLNGRRSSPEPSLRLEMKDGREIDLADMFSLGPNGPETAAWLNAVEGVVQAARYAGIAKASRHPEQGWLHFDRGCVTGLSERFSADDRARVVALFALPS
ncbi:hypothetical protein D3C72_1129670 [compost metagenome]